MFYTREGASRAAKDLRKAFRSVGVEQPLSACQETVARYVGYTNWHEALSRIDAGQPVQSSINRRAGIKSIVEASLSRVGQKMAGSTGVVAPTMGVTTPGVTPPAMDHDPDTDLDALLGRKRSNNPTLKLACSLYAGALWAVHLSNQTDRSGQTASHGFLRLVFALHLMEQTGLGLGAALSQKKPAILTVAQKLASDVRCRRKCQLQNPTLFENLAGFPAAAAAIVEQGWLSDDGMPPREYDVFQRYSSFSRVSTMGLSGWHHIVTSGDAPPRLEMPGLCQPESWEGFGGAVVSGKSLWPGNLVIEGMSGSGKSTLAAGLLRCVRRNARSEGLAVRLVATDPEVTDSVRKECPKIAQGYDLFEQSIQPHECDTITWYPITGMDYKDRNNDFRDRNNFLLDALVIQIATSRQQKAEGRFTPSLLILDESDPLTHVPPSFIAKLVNMATTGCYIWLVRQSQADYSDYAAHKIECFHPDEPSRITTPDGKASLFERPVYLDRIGISATMQHPKPASPDRSREQTVSFTSR